MRWRTAWYYISSQRSKQSWRSRHTCLLMFAELFSLNRPCRASMPNSGLTAKLLRGTREALALAVEAINDGGAERPDARQLRNAAAHQQ